LARKANFKSFEDLGIQNLGISSNLTFSQQTFAESLKLPYPLLSDFPDRKLMRSYGVLNEASMTAHRSVFLIDPQGILRKKWIVENGATTLRFQGGEIRTGQGLWVDIRDLRAAPLAADPEFVRALPPTLLTIIGRPTAICSSTCAQMPSVRKSFSSASFLHVSQRKSSMGTQAGSTT
jgi:hypothetical protein